jgi:hypothetical protein
LRKEQLFCFQTTTGIFLGFSSIMARLVSERSSTIAGNKTGEKVIHSSGVATLSGTLLKNWQKGVELVQNNEIFLQTTWKMSYFLNISSFPSGSRKFTIQLC